jgi:hypothetical protein
MLTPTPTWTGARLARDQANAPLLTRCGVGVAGSVIRRTTFPCSFRIDVRRENRFRRGRCRAYRDCRAAVPSPARRRALCRTTFETNLGCTDLHTVSPSTIRGTPRISFACRCPEELLSPLRSAVRMAIDSRMIGTTSSLLWLFPAVQTFTLEINRGPARRRVLSRRRDVLCVRELDSTAARASGLQKDRSHPCKSPASRGRMRAIRPPRSRCS